MTNETKKRPTESEDEVRLNVFLQESGVASRRKADELIEAGLVKVNGKSVTQLGTRISRSDKVHVHGKLLTVKNIPKVIYLLNKPDMCLTTRFDAKGRRTIFDLPAVKSLPPNVQAVGRLDYRSEGLLLLTNDGDLAYALTHPKFSVEKTYAVLVADGVTIEDVEKLRAGVMLDDGLAKAVSVRLGNKERLGVTRGQWLELVVTEGRNRLIRRMAEAIGLKVVRLVRVGMGDVLLPATLKPGQAIVVESSARHQLEQIKTDMLRSFGADAERAANDQIPDAASRAKRKLRRRVKLNDEEYQIEASRRSAEASIKRKQRGQEQRAAAMEKDRPVPRPATRRAGEDASRPIPRGEAGAPVKERRPEGRPMRSDRRPEPRSESRPEARPARGERRPESRPEARPARGERRPESRPEARPARGDRRAESRPESRPARGERRPESRPESRPARGERRPESRPEPRATRVERQPRPDSRGTDRIEKPARKSESSSRDKFRSAPSARPAKGKNDQRKDRSNKAKRS